MDNLNRMLQQSNQLYETLKPFLETQKQVERILQNQVVLDTFTKAILRTEEILNPILESAAKTQKIINSFADSIIKDPMLIDVCKNYNLIAEKLDYFETINPDFLTSRSLNNILDSLSTEIQKEIDSSEDTKIDDSPQETLNLAICNENVDNLKDSFLNNDTTFDFHKWICTISAIICIIFAILNYLKPTNDVEYLKLLKEINLHLEQVIQLESEK